MPVSAVEEPSECKITKLFTNCAAKSIDFFSSLLYNNECIFKSGRVGGVFEDFQKGFRITMMKKLLALFLALLAVASFAACKKDGNDKNNSNNNYKQDEIVLTSVTIGNDTFSFETLDSDSVAITGYTGSNDLHDITIPTEVQTGADETTIRKVTAIRDSAFYATSSLRSVVIPEGITSIGDYAFAKCTQLQTVSFPSSIAHIGKYAFQESGLTSLNFPATCGLTEISDHTFNACNSLTEVVIPGYIKTIGIGAFYGCEKIAKVTLSEGVETVGKQAFQNNPSLADLILPASFTNTDPREDLAFSGSDVLYRSHIVCPEGSAAEAYADKMVLKFEPEGEAN